jgi:hypothetical protein
VNTADSSHAQLATKSRQVFMRHVIEDLPQVAERVEQDLLERSETVMFGTEGQRLRDASRNFKLFKADWLQRCTDGLGRMLKVKPAAEGVHALGEELSLVGEETVENQILAARAALVAVDKGSDAFNEWRLRLQHLELTDELDKRDPAQALNVLQVVVDAWLSAGLTRLDWQVSQAVLHSALARLVAAGYAEANRFLLQRGVMPEIDLRDLVRKAARSSAAGRSGGSAPASLEASDPPAYPASSMGGLTHVVPTAGRASGPAPMAGLAAGEPATSGPYWPGQGTPAMTGAGGSVANGMSGPLAQLAEAVTHDLARFMAQQVPNAATWFQSAGSTGPAGPGRPATEAGATSQLPSGPPPAWLAIPRPPEAVWNTLESGAAAVRQHARDLKKAATTQEDKALIELVALIFDSILSEDRIPSSIRLWFARLQMPVLRNAVADPTFLASDAHPARLLIDRMGSCVLGFDPSVPLEALEREIKRIVQVIEQYPETGRRVFELMLKEFEAFLAKAVREQPRLNRVVDVASQVELKGTLTVQYTIELRKLLGEAPVLESLRTFLFHTWAEVMAQASVVYGKHAESAVMIRQLAADLLWAASAKPSRQERAQVIARVPSLMTQLREGLALLGYDAVRQEAEIKPVSDALAAAFISQTAAIDPRWLAKLTVHLGKLEDIITPADTGDLALSRDNVEMITGQDASNVTVLPNVDTSTPKHLLAWAKALPVGGWHSLEHNGQPVLVQLAWQSPRKQLFLFVNGAQQSWLMQQGRVAQYLKAGLLRSTEGEALTTRATRQALDKLKANPERLLA